MYNGNQPPYPPAGGYPPYPPPGFSGGQAGAPAYPPFLPPNTGAYGNYPPPVPGQYPPGFSPPAGFPPFPATAPPAFRPPPTGTPYLPSKPGIGAVSHYIAPVSTASIMSNATPRFVNEVKTQTCFVSGIAPGITDDTLRRLLNACGPLHELKRVAGASGQPQGFGFALFVENPEVIMRAVRCLNGVELPDLTLKGRQEGLTKKLGIKPDEKTREFLEEFHKSVPRTAADEAGDARTNKSIAYIIQLLTDPNAPASPSTRASALPSAADQRAAAQAAVPLHLKDLNEGDLPEAQREVVLDQIAIFREQAARKEKERKMLEADKERFKMNESWQQPQQQHQQQQQGGMNQQRQWGRPSPASQQSPAGQASSGFGNGPQSYQTPVGFVKSQAPEGKGVGERTDEEEEELRQMQKLRERETLLRERERRLETRERQRIDTLTRDASRIKHEDESEARERKILRERLELWDDDEKIARGRELFYTDRDRWRNVRAAARRREYQDDVRDRQQEADELARIERESEAFMQKQMAEMAQYEVKKREEGHLFDDAAPIKLAIVPEVIKKEVSTPKAEDKKPNVKPKIAFEEDDEEKAEAERKKKRTLVKLDYTGPAVPEAERVAKRRARLLEVKTALPTDQKKLFRLNVEWAAVNESAITRKFRPFVKVKMTDYLGELEDDDLVNFVLEQLRDHKRPEDMVEGLRPILEEEAVAFTIQLWRQLSFESTAFAEGLETDSMTV